MKKINLIIGILISSLAFSQVKTNNSVYQSSINDQTPFLDASSSSDWNASTNKGKGLVFPRVDLVELKQIVGPTRVGSTNAPTYYDGMVVYNTASGDAGVSGVRVDPGFYYYENKTTNINGGTWKPLGNSSSSEAIKVGNTDNLTCSKDNRGKMNFTEVTKSNGKKTDVLGICMKNENGEYYWRYFYGGMGNTTGTGAFGSDLK